MNSVTTIVRNTPRAWSAVALFSVFGVVGIVLRMEEDLLWVLPQVISYATLVIQTFFSVRRFSGVLDATHPLQRTTDGLLVLMYAGMAWSFAAPTQFLVFFAAMFAIAVLKYAAHPPKDPVDAKPLRRKAIANSLGCVACLAVVGLTSLHPAMGAWTWAIAFVLIDAYVLGPGKLYA